MAANISDKQEDYAYPTLPELKKRTAEVMREFHPVQIQKKNILR